MSKRVSASFTCPFCECENHIQPIKPTPFQFTLNSCECEVCGSKFVLKCSLIKGRPGMTQFDSTKVEPSGVGLQMRKELDLKNAGNSAGPNKEEVQHATE